MFSAGAAVLGQGEAIDQALVIEGLEVAVVVFVVAWHQRMSRDVGMKR